LSTGGFPRPFVFKYPHLPGGSRRNFWTSSAAPDSSSPQWCRAVWT